jgi:hypothetical protein
MKTKPDDADALREALDALCLMIESRCADNAEGASLDSNGMSNNAFAMRVLAKHRRIEIEQESLRVVRGRWSDLSWIDRLSVAPLAQQRVLLHRRRPRKLLH